MATKLKDILENILDDEKVKCEKQVSKAAALQDLLINNDDPYVDLIATLNRFPAYQKKLQDTEQVISDILKYKSIHSDLIKIILKALMQYKSDLYSILTQTYH